MYQGRKYVLAKSKQVPVNYKGLDFIFDIPSSVSEVDLIIKETFKDAKIKPTEKEVLEVFELLKLATKKKE